MNKKIAFSLALFVLAFFAGSQITFAATLGNTSAGASSAGQANRLVVTKFTMPNESGMLTSVSMYVTTAASAPNNQLQLAVYADQGGVPGALVAASSTQAISTNAWNTLSLSGSLSAGAVYWLGVNTNGTNALSYDNASAGASYFRVQTFGTMPASFGTLTANPISLAIYATYTPDAGAPPTPPSDTTPPTVSISAPSSGSTVSGTTSIIASASDDTAVAGVQFKMDGSNIGSEDTSAPYSYSLDSTSVSNGTHSITAVARDTSDNITTSTAVSVMVSNTVAPTPTPDPTPGPTPTPTPTPSNWTSPVGIPHPGNWFLSTTGSVTNVTSGGTSRTFTGTGTASTPIIFQGVGAPNFTGTVTISGSYVIVDGIHVSGGGVVRFSGDHLELRNSEVNGNNRAISSITVGFSGATDVVIYKNSIHDNGNWQSTTENDIHGIGGGGATAAQNVWILENEMYHQGGDSVQFGHQGANRVSGVYIGRNNMHDDRENAIDIKEASNFVVSENTMYGYRQTSSSEGAAVVVHYCPIDSHILNNNIYDSQIAISTTSLTAACSGITAVSRFMGNVIHDILGNGVQGWGSGKVTNVVGNTFYNIGGTGIDITNASAGSSIENNIFSNVTGSDIVVAGGNVTQRNNLADTSNAQFVNAAGGNFRLQSSSPAINTGVSSSVYSAFQSIFGVSAAYDRDGNSRPAGSAWDIGAYEFGGTATPPPPPPPSSTKTITAFNLSSPSTTGVINNTNHTVTLTVPFGTNVTALAPVITHTGVSISPNTGVARNFTAPQTYTVTAADASTQTYTVTVSVIASAAKSLTSFNFTSPSATGTINNTNRTVSLTVPFGTNVASLTPSIVHNGAFVSPASGIAQNFTTPQLYTVTAADSSTQTYTVTVIVTPGSSTKSLISFNFSSPSTTGSIDNTNHTVSLTVPYATNLTALVPSITYNGSSISPLSGVARNFTTPQTYTVTAADFTTQTYVVTANVASAPPVTPTPNTPGGGGGGGGGGPGTPSCSNVGQTCPTATPISGCGTRTTGFSSTTGASCVGNSLSTNNPRPSTYNFGTVTLRNGSRGEAVKELQRYLNATLNLGLVVDGKLGPKTIAVIKKWQSDNGLVADGLIGAKTKAKMNASL